MRRFKDFIDFYIYISGIVNSFQFVFPNQQGFDNFIEDVMPRLQEIERYRQFTPEVKVLYLSLRAGEVYLSDNPLKDCCNYELKFTHKSIFVSSHN